MNKGTLFTSMLLITFLCRRTDAGLGRRTGSEQELWTIGRYSIVIGTLKNIKVVSQEGRREATFIPEATICGSFDCGAHAELPIAFYALRNDTSIQEVPREGSMVMGFMQYNPKGPDYKVDSGFFSAAICHFMPGESALVSIKGLDDPVIHKTLQLIQKARTEESP